MSRPPAHHRPKAGTGVALAALLGSATLTAAVAATAGPVVQVVVSYQAGAVSVPGIRVVADLPAVHAAVVRGTGAAIVRLEHTAGVRGVARDDVVHLTGENDNNNDGADGVFPAAGIKRNGLDGSGIRVAVLDSGLTDSAALNRASGRVVDAVDTSALADGGSVSTAGPFTDGFGHGTFMASLIAGGQFRKGSRLLGVAPGATVVVVKVAKADGTTSLSTVVAGLNWVAQHPGSVDVANLSFGHSRPGDAFGADPLTDAVEKVRAAGIVMVVSAGNTAGTVSDPGFDPRVITVGAADLSGDSPTVAPFSGSATVDGVVKPDLVANGVHVMGVLPADSLIAKANPSAAQRNGLWLGSGTSQATAVTSGTAALLLSKYPNATPAQIKGSLRDAANNVSGSGAGAGLLQSVKKLTSSADGQALDGRGDLTGEGTFDASSWSASSWSASSWSASSWSASSWSASSWSASSWSASSWSFVLPDPPPAPAP